MVTPRFRHAFVPRVELTTTDGEEGRVYHTPDGDFLSVTTILKYATDDSGLRAWRERVGEDAANKVSAQASYRGTAVHAIAEKYLMNDPDWHKDAMPFNLSTFYSLKSRLDEAVGEIWGVEYPLWSPRLATAGRVDLICEWYGEPAIVDFKTARKFHGETSPVTKKYLLQTATYAKMAHERTGINIRKLVILFSPDDMLKGYAVVRNAEDYEPQMEMIFAKKNRDFLAIPQGLLDASGGLTSSQK